MEQDGGTRRNIDEPAGSGMPRPERDWLAERVEYLNLLRSHGQSTDEDRENIDAVLQAYRDGSLRRPTGGRGVIFFGGTRRTDEVDVGSFDWGTALEWAKELEGKRARLYIERENNTRWA